MDLTHHFLLAMPGLAESYFDKTLTYLYEHNSDGALGFIVNRTSTMTVGEIFKQLDIATESQSLTELPVYEGGPVAPQQGFVLQLPDDATDEPPNVNRAGISLSGSLDALQPLARGEINERFMILLGYAGWHAGQLETEIGQNAWLTCSADSDILFHENPDLKFDLAAKSLGIDFNAVSHESGHA
jgi:putative transcriptional regulator